MTIKRYDWEKDYQPKVRAGIKEWFAENPGGIDSYVKLTGPEEAERFARNVAIFESDLGQGNEFIGNPAKYRQGVFQIKEGSKGAKEDVKTLLYQMLKRGSPNPKNTDFPQTAQMRELISHHPEYAASGAPTAIPAGLLPQMYLGINPETDAIVSKYLWNTIAGAGSVPDYISKMKRYDNPINLAEKGR